MGLRLGLGLGCGGLGVVGRGRGGVVRDGVGRGGAVGMCWKGRLVAGAAVVGHAPALGHIRAENPIPDDQHASVVAVARRAVVHAMRHRRVEDIPTVCQ